MTAEPELLELDVLKDKNDLASLRELLAKAESVTFRCYLTQNEGFIEASESISSPGKVWRVKIWNFFLRSTWRHIRDFISSQKTVRVKKVTLYCCADLIWVLEPISKQIQDLDIRFEARRREDWIDSFVPIFPLLQDLRLCHPHGLRGTETANLLSCFANYTTLKVVEITEISSLEESTVAKMIRLNRGLQCLNLDFCCALTSSFDTKVFETHGLQELVVDFGYRHYSSPKTFVQACFTLPMLRRLKLIGLQYMKCKDWVGDVIASGRTNLTDISIPLSCHAHGGGDIVDAILEGATRNQYVKKFSIYRFENGKVPSNGVLSELFLQNQTMENLTTYFDAEMTPLKSLARNNSLKSLRLKIDMEDKANYSELLDSIGHALASNTVLENLRLECQRTQQQYRSQPIPEQTATLFAAGLSKNQTLKEFSFKNLDAGKHETLVVDALRGHPSMMRFEIAFNSREKHEKQVQAWCRWNAVVAAEYSKVSDELLLPDILGRASARGVSMMYFCLQARMDLLTQAMLRLPNEATAGKKLTGAMKVGATTRPKPRSRSPARKKQTTKIAVRQSSEGIRKRRKT